MWFSCKTLVSIFKQIRTIKKINFLYKVCPEMTHLLNTKTYIFFQMLHGIFCLISNNFGVSNPQNSSYFPLVAYLRLFCPSSLPGLFYYILHVNKKNRTLVSSGNSSDWLITIILPEENREWMGGTTELETHFII